jgi:hypothetical protein
MKLLPSGIARAVFVTGLCWYGLSCTREPDGETLARQTCSSCHVFPEPAMLDKASWATGVLPQMAVWAGVTPLTEAPGMGFNDDMVRILTSGVLPARPLVTPAAWKRIVDWYVSQAPDSLLPDSLPAAAFQPLEGQFGVQSVPGFEGHEVTLLQHDSLRHLLVAGTRTGGLYWLDPLTGVRRDSFRFGSPPTSIALLDQHRFILALPGVMEPNDKQQGSLIRARRMGDTLAREQVIRQLARPVHVTWADITGDGIPESVVSEYGHYAGQLAWYSQDGNQPDPHVLYAASGTIKTIVQDMNGDGRPDIVALTGQGREGVWIYYNQGGGQFQAQYVLSFPSVYGSLDLELADINQDGHMDLLYANGDNADRSPILKPYHGVRIFLNDGHNQFSQAYFFPLHGAMKVMARDFDLDGDLDIAATAFFPDYSRRPHLGFIYLRQDGPLVFTPHATAATDTGRWMLMDTYDADRDGDLDIVLGACSMIPGQATTVRRSADKVSIVMLRNEAVSRHNSAHKVP